MAEPEQSEGFQQTGSRDNRSPDAGGKDSRSATPRISRGLLRAFYGYSRWYLRRHFHAVRLLRGTSPVVGDARPLVVYLHHASWWDPLVGLLLAREWFPHRTLYAPIDAQALRQYRFFARLGFLALSWAPSAVRPRSCARAWRSFSNPAPRSGSRRRVVSPMCGKGRFDFGPGLGIWLVAWKGRSFCPWRSSTFFGRNERRKC